MVCPGDQNYIKFSPLLSFKTFGQNKICDIKYTPTEDTTLLQNKKKKEEKNQEKGS